jgi:HAMP domain-containing protein
VSLSQGELVAMAYAVVFVFVLAYVAIIAAKLVRLQRETAELVELARARTSGRAPDYSESVPGEQRAGRVG